jgi:predicted HD phosphohydrolase
MYKNDILKLYKNFGQNKYSIGENISQISHAVQASRYASNLLSKNTDNYLFITSRMPILFDQLYNKCGYKEYNMRIEKHEKHDIELGLLLHDIGQLIYLQEIEKKDFDQSKFNSEHEIFGGEFLRNMGFPLNITIPVQNHVDAKRYLCSRNPDYVKNLSEASVHSLKLQNGKMNATEISRFENSPYFLTSIFYRLADDTAKIEEVTYSMNDFEQMFIYYLKEKNM